MAPQRREGDWDCPDCGAVNFASRETCFKCEQIAGGGGGGSGQAREGDWVCPDCGTLVFASKDSCFKCNKNAGDWNCPSCGVLVFASKTACFQCDTPRPKNGATGKFIKNKASAAPSGGGSAVGQSDPIKALAKISPKFKKTWSSYCKSTGQGFSDPSKCTKEFITEFADYVAALIEASLEAPEEGDEAEPEAAAAESAEEAPQKRQAAAPAPAQAPAPKRKLTMKKVVADEIQRLNGQGTLQAKIGLAAVARPLSELGEEKALEVLALLDASQDEIEDPNAWICAQAQEMVEAGDD